MVNRSDRGPGRAPEKLDIKVSSKQEEPASQSQEDKAPRQGLQPAQPATAKQGRSLIHSAELMSGTDCRCVETGTGSEHRKRLWGDGEGARCKPFNEKAMAAVLCFVECPCDDCSSACEWLAALAGRKQDKDRESSK
jgi:hypothetical protein